MTESELDEYYSWLEMQIRELKEIAVKYLNEGRFERYSQLLERREGLLMARDYLHYSIYKKEISSIHKKEILENKK